MSGQEASSSSSSSGGDGNGSGGSGRPAPGPLRTDTQTEAPLSDQEFRVLQEQLHQSAGSTIANLIAAPTGPSSSAAAGNPSWLTQNVVTQNLIGGRADTLERNPVCIDPNQLTSGADMVVTADEFTQPDQQAHLSYQQPQQQQQQQQQPQQQQVMHEIKLETGQQQIFFNDHNVITVVQNTDQQWADLNDMDPSTAATTGGHQPVVQSPNTPQTSSGATTPQPQLQMPQASGAFQMQQQPQQPEEPQIDAPPTCANPSSVVWPGVHDFKVFFLKMSQSLKNTSWDYSTELNKLYIDWDKYVQIGFNAGDNPPKGLFIRALPVYADASSFSDPVKRCPNHAAESHASNDKFPLEFREHLIRVNHDAAVYDEDKTSGRLSVVMPFDRPQVGTNHCLHLLKFMCLGSDVGGINRRPVKLIFTLERGPGEVVGRYQVEVRICSCPKRDKQQEEDKHKVKKQALGLANNLARSNSVFTKPSAKKRKVEVEEFIMVPVAQADFEKVNEMAEAAVIVRNPGKAGEIKAQRRKLLEQHNKKFLNKPKQ